MQRVSKHRFEASLIRSISGCIACACLAVQCALAYSYEDILLIGQLENKLYGQQNSSAPLGERLANAEKTVFGNVQSGSESKRIKNMCRKAGLESPFLTDASEAGPEVPEKIASGGGLRAKYLPALKAKSSSKALNEIEANKASTKNKEIAIPLASPGTSGLKPDQRERAKSDSASETATQRAVAKAEPRIASHNEALATAAQVQSSNSPASSPTASLFGEPSSSVASTSSGESSLSRPDAAYDVLLRTFELFLAVGFCGGGLITMLRLRSEQNESRQMHTDNANNLHAVETSISQNLSGQESSSSNVDPVADAGIAGHPVGSEPEPQQQASLVHDECLNIDCDSDLAVTGEFIVGADGIATGAQQASGENASRTSEEPSNSMTESESEFSAILSGESHVITEAACAVSELPMHEPADVAPPEMALTDLYSLPEFLAPSAVEAQQIVELSVDEAVVSPVAAASAEPQQLPFNAEDPSVIAIAQQHAQKPVQVQGSSEDLAAKNLDSMNSYYVADMAPNAVETIDSTKIGAFLGFLAETCTRPEGNEVKSEDSAELESACKHFSAAMANLARVLTSTSHNAASFNLRANASIITNEPGGALEEYSRVLANMPDDYETYNKRALTRLALGDEQGALEDFAKCLSLNPNFVLAYHNRAAVLHALGDHEAASQDYTSLLRLYPAANEAYSGRALAKLQIGDLQGAMTDANCALTRYGGMQLAAYKVRVAVRLQTGDLAGALRDANEAMLLNPEDLETKALLQRVQAALTAQEVVVS